MRKPAKVIAEIGCNHKGDMEVAKELVKVAKIFCGADIVKFQKRSPKELLSKKQYNSPHPVPHNSYGKTYGEHRERLEFSDIQHAELKKFCQNIGISYSASVWDLTSAEHIASLNPSIIKIPSACNLDFALLDFLCDNYRGQIHLSLGMTNRSEEEKIVEFFQKKNRLKAVVLYSCTAGYPVEDSDVCLLEIERLIGLYKKDVNGIGFSGHHKGIAIDIAAFTLGVEWIERHFTLDRTWKGTDHAASLEPDGLRRIVRDVKTVAEALNYKKKEILDVEELQRTKLKRIF